MKVRATWAVLPTAAMLSASACGAVAGANGGDSGRDAHAGDAGRLDVREGAATRLRDAETESEVKAPTAPRPIAPLSTSRVTSRRPTFHWILPSGVADATLDVCLDRACMRPIGEPVRVTGTQYVPTAELPVGVVYWRVHPGAATTVTSATWQFTVGARTAPVDSSWGTTLDVNGDGYADIVVGAYGTGLNGRAYVYLGSKSGVSAVPAATLTGPVEGFFGESIASAGDVNGDGYADIVVGDDSALRSTGRAYVYLGGPAGLSAVPATTLTGPDVDGWFGESVASAGDVNGDGYADIVVGAYLVMGQTGSVYVYLGSATGVATAPSVTLAGPGGTVGLFGVSVASVGDVNGDGYADIVVGATGVTGGTGRAFVFLGGASGLATVPATTLTSLDVDGLFGGSVASAGDVNGDGYADLVVGAQDVAMLTGRVDVYLGGGNGLATVPATVLTGPDGPGGGFGGSVASAGDVNGDGYADLVVGAECGSGPTGRTYVYLGGESGLATVPATLLTGPDGPGGAFGGSVASAGDVSGDGYADLVVGAYAAVGWTGRAYVYLSSRGGSAAAPDTTLTGSQVDGSFGSCVFGATD